MSSLLDEALKEKFRTDAINVLFLTVLDNSRKEL